MGKFIPIINQIITHLLSAGVKRTPPRSKSAFERHGFQCHSHKYIRGSYIQKSSHINKVPHVFTTLEIKSMPIHTHRSEEEVRPPTKTHIPTTPTRSHVQTEKTKSTNPLKYREIPLLEA